MINNLTFDVDDTDYHMPPVPRSDVSSKPLKYNKDDHIVLDDYTSLTLMCSVSYIFVTTIFFPSYSSYHDTLELFQHFYNTNMETAEYWPMAREYGIWNAAIASLQF